MGCCKSKAEVAPEVREEGDATERGAPAAADGTDEHASLVRASWLDECVRLHNERRRNHHAGDVLGDKRLCAHAQAQAEACLASSRVAVGHCMEYDEGQNVYAAILPAGSRRRASVAKSMGVWETSGDRQNIASDSVLAKGKSGQSLGLTGDGDVEAGDADAGADIAPVEEMEVEDVHGDSGHSDLSRNPLGVGAGANNSAAGTAPQAGAHAATAPAGGPQHGALFEAPPLPSSNAPPPPAGDAQDELVFEHVRSACAKWYKQISRYRAAQGGVEGLDNGAEHFTQMVWCGTTHIGLGVAFDTAQMYVVVNYAPAGNEMDDDVIRENVIVEGMDTPRVDKEVVQAGVPDAPPGDGSLMLEDVEEGEARTPADADMVPAAAPPIPIAKAAANAWGTTSAVTPATPEDAAVQEHNDMRAAYGAPPVTHDPALAVHARAQADACLARGAIHYGNYTEFNEGQNIFMTVYSGCNGATDVEYVRRACSAWEEERERYVAAGGGLAGLQNQAGHFTQAVWAGTHRVGVGVARDSGKVFVVVNYAPLGNLLNDRTIRENVKVVAERRGSVPRRRSSACPPPLPATSIVIPTAQLEALQATAVRLHNMLRANHDAPPLTVDAVLAHHAQEHAARCLNAGAISQNPPAGEGQNVLHFTWTGYTPTHEEIVQSCIEKWYTQRGVYNPADKASLTAAGNFTQMVWRRSRRAGLGIARGEGSAFVVMHYQPQGNVYDEADIAQNVCM